MPETGTPEVFQNVAEALRYLQQAGWRVGKATIYKHAKVGKLPVRKDGTVPRSVVDRYAQQWLKPRDPDAVPEPAIRLKRLRADLRRARERAALAESRVKRMAREFILPEQADLDLAARRTLFEEHLPDLAARLVQAVIDISGGDPVRAEAARGRLLAELTKCLEVYVLSDSDKHSWAISAPGLDPQQQDEHAV